MGVKVGYEGAGKQAVAQHANLGVALTGVGVGGGGCDVM